MHLESEKIGFVLHFFVLRRASFAIHPAFGSALEIGFVFSVERRRAFP
jgi:hypothetical protein